MHMNLGSTNSANSFRLFIEILTVKLGPSCMIHRAKLPKPAHLQLNFLPLNLK